MMVEQRYACFIAHHGRVLPQAWLVDGCLTALVRDKMVVVPATNSEAAGHPAKSYPPPHAAIETGSTRHLHDSGARASATTAGSRPRGGRRPFWEEDRWQGVSRDGSDLADWL